MFVSPSIRQTHSPHILAAMTTGNQKKPYFGFTGGWLTFWITVACATDMTLFGYDQAVFSKSMCKGLDFRLLTNENRWRRHQ
jgi:hypothetical protein